jgi:hypothetical protein
MALLFIIPDASLPARAAWSTNPSENTPVCTLGQNQYGVQLLSDGAGGVIMVWQDFRPLGAESNIFAQRVGGSGSVLWAADGVAVCTIPGDQLEPQLASDGAGGTIIAWEDHRSGTAEHVYAQRVDAWGDVLWAANGIGVCTASGVREMGWPTTDDAGGAIIVWADARSGNYDIYAQRVNGSGTMLWPINGQLVCTASSTQSWAWSVRDGAGGAIIFWRDMRAGPDVNIYAQRMNASGSPLWTANGVPLTNGHFTGIGVYAVSDGAGGAIVAWADLRSGIDSEIYAQRLNGSGQAVWEAGGRVICAADGNQTGVTLASDGMGGAFISWIDERWDSDGDVYIQHVNVTGQTYWPTDGVAVRVADGIQFAGAMVSDGAGG